MTNSSADIKATCDKETKLPSPPKTADALSIPAKVKSLEPTRQAVTPPLYSAVTAKIEAQVSMS